MTEEDEHSDDTAVKHTIKRMGETSPESNDEIIDYDKLLKICKNIDRIIVC